MKVYYSGFNLYGQLINSKDLVVPSFTDFRYESLSDLSLNHSYSLIKTGNDVYYLHGFLENKTHEIRKLVNIDGHNICSTSCFDNYVLFLSKDGTILKLDINKSQDVEIIPNLLKTGSDFIVNIAGGLKVNIALSKYGKLFNMSNKLEFEDGNIVQIVTGREHSLLLDKFGNVYSLGIGSRGQLGHGCLANQTEPKVVEALRGMKITKVAAGGWHSCALSECGDLYTWGWNGNGQLGLHTCTEDNDNATSVMATPHLLNFENANNANAVQVACGAKHTIVLLDNNRVYGMGWNKYKQLGNIDCENIHKATVVYDLGNPNGVLKCGPWSSAVLVT